MVSAIFIVTLALLESPRKATACEPTACLKAISARVAVTPLELPEAALLGNWGGGPGLSGSELYFFHDHTYIYTEWADVEPETIYDKGRWTVAAGVLTLVPDRDVTWSPKNDRRFLTVRETGQAINLLFGLDRNLELFHLLIKEEPQYAQDYFRLSSRKRLRAWSQADAPSIKADLMRRCWKPNYHRQ